MSYSCRICSAPLSDVLIDLGSSPPSNSYLTEAELDEPEVHLPLVVYSCSSCSLVQLPAHARPEQIFAREYLYFSGYSASWREHTRQYAEKMIDELGLSERSLVLEVASNDGTTLGHFRNRGIPVLGVEPARNVAAAAIASGIDTRVMFLSADSSAHLPLADLVHGANVLAHVPDLHDFCEGLRNVLKPGGTLTLEFPSVVELVRGGAFDTIYHEHYSYLSLVTASRVLAEHGLEVYDVEQLQTHGGSLRLYAALLEDAPAATDRVRDLLVEEHEFYDSDYGSGFRSRVRHAKWKLVSELIAIASRGDLTLGFGAPAKATTLLNYCGIREDLLPFVTDDNPLKQSRYMPGSRIPILPVDALLKRRPENVLVLPWNLRRDALGRLGDILDATNLIYPIDS